MYDQTNNRSDAGLIAVIAIFTGTIYLIGRTLYLLKTLVPVWARRAKEDLKTAWQVYRGNNIRIIYLDQSEPTINHYHTRYEGTERAANDEIGE